MRILLPLAALILLSACSLLLQPDADNLGSPASDGDSDGNLDGNADFDGAMGHDGDVATDADGDADEHADTDGHCTPSCFDRESGPNNCGGTCAPGCSPTGYDTWLYCAIRCVDDSMCPCGLSCREFDGGVRICYP